MNIDQLPCSSYRHMENYAVLCRDRVSQMTKTYNDIDAVTRLLEEKEQDLELAARIGQTLLTKNKEVSSRAESLEEQLSAANDKVNQLRHDLSLKDELLKIYNEDLEHVAGAAASLGSKGNPENVDFLEKKVKALEDENLHLKLESAQLKSDTDSYEEKEKKLVEDCICQIGDLNRQVETLAEELHLKARENVQHREEVTMYLSQVTGLQKKIRTLTTENMDLNERLTASTDSQRMLTKELAEMQDRYDELFELLEHSQEDLRLMREREKKKMRYIHQSEVSMESTDSLASELEQSLQQQAQLRDQIDNRDQLIELKQLQIEERDKQIEEEQLQIHQSHQSVEPINTLVDHSVKPTNEMVDHSVKPTNEMIGHSVKPTNEMVDHSIKLTNEMVDHSVKPTNDVIDHSIEPTNEMVEKSVQQTVASCQQREEWVKGDKNLTDNNATETVRSSVRDSLGVRDSRSERDSNLRDSNLRDGNIRDGNIRDGNIRDDNMRDDNLRDSLSVTAASSNASSRDSSRGSSVSRERSWKIFETTRAAKRAAEIKALEKEMSSLAVRMSVTETPRLLRRKDSDAASLGAVSVGQDSLSNYSEDASQISSSHLSTAQPHDLSFGSAGGYDSDIDSLYSSNPALGQPGIPGSNDLESALRRLAIRRANELNERDFLYEEERRRKQQEMSTRWSNGQTSPYHQSSSMNSNMSSSSIDSRSGYRRSDKLQIVKPMEGSVTLKHWQQLATPHLSGMFQSREGVQMKSEKPAKPKEDMEDAEACDIQTRRQHDSGMIYTFTDSTICHMASSEKQNTLYPTSHISGSPASLLNQTMSECEPPIHCSTPKQQHGLDHQPNNNNASNSELEPVNLGLASLLDSNESVLSRTAPGIQKSAAPSNQTLENLSLDNSCEHLLPIPLNSSSLAYSRSRNLPGSRSYEQMMQESEERSKVESSVSSPAVVLPPSASKGQLLTPGMTGQGLIQQLKNKGLSLYGLWGSSGNKTVGGEDSKEDSKASDVDKDYSSSRESTPEKTPAPVSSRGLGVLGAISKCGRNRDL